MLGLLMMQCDGVPTSNWMTKVDKDEIARLTEQYGEE
jgi:hypothetical protein